MELLKLSFAGAFGHDEVSWSKEETVKYCKHSQPLKHKLQVELPIGQSNSPISKLLHTVILASVGRVIVNNYNNILILVQL